MELELLLLLNSPVIWTYFQTAFYKPDDVTGS